MRRRYRDAVGMARTHIGLCASMVTLLLAADDAAAADAAAAAPLPISPLLCRRLLTTLGVANKRLYELRLQTSAEDVDKLTEVIGVVQQSFRVREVEA